MCDGGGSVQVVGHGRRGPVDDRFTAGTRRGDFHIHGEVDDRRTSAVDQTSDRVRRGAEASVLTGSYQTNDDCKEAELCSEKELQMSQIRGVEQAIERMAAQLKEEMAEIQHETLTEMEGTALDNVENLVNVTDDVKTHVRQQTMVSTWAMLFAIAGCFLFCLIIIYVVPKQQGTSTCLVFYNDHFLPAGQQECIQQDMGL